MRRIRDDVARRKAAAGRAAAAMDPAPAPAGAAVGAAAPLQSTIALPRVPESAGLIEHKDRYALADFLVFQDEDFVRNAYRGILRREPDANGFAAFLEALRQGRLAKVEVLGRMRYSAEGRTAGVPIRALPLAFALRSARRVPVFGRMLGIVQYLVRLPDIARNHELLEAAFFQRQFELNRQINTASGRIERGITQVQRSLQDVAAAARANIDGVRAEMATATRVGALEQSVDTLANAKADRGELGRIAEQVEGKVGAAQLIAVNERTRATELGLNALWRDMQTLAELQSAMVEAMKTGSGVGEASEPVGARGRMPPEHEQKVTALIDKAHHALHERESVAGTSAAGREDVHLFDAFYAAFENRFRGTPEDIRQRVAVYLPYVREARVGNLDSFVLDIGCGRGEWLELLRDNGIEARGVDLNRVTAAQCRERGLDVIEADAIEHLRELETDSLRAVTAMHVIEHIPFRRLIVLFDEVLRVLQPGGVAIFETPNPENLVVGACSFYYDPTHERPLPPEPTRFVAELRGFADVSILRLHPVAEHLQLADGTPAMREIINRMFFCARDYALIARKPMR